jgi:hypothetical protein
MIATTQQRAPLIFTTADRPSLPVTIDGKEYILCEATADIAAEYRSVTMRGAKFDADGKAYSAPENIGESLLVLLAGCLYRMTKGGKQCVTQRFIKELPSPVSEALHEACLDLNPLLRNQLTRKQVVKQIERMQEQLARMDEAAANSTEGNLPTPEEEAKNLQ